MNHTPGAAPAKLMRTAVQTPRLPHLSGGAALAPRRPRGLCSRGTTVGAGPQPFVIDSFLSCLTSSPSSWYFLGPSPPRKDLQSHPVLESIGGTPKQDAQPLPQTRGQGTGPRAGLTWLPQWPGQQGAVTGVGVEQLPRGTGAGQRDSQDRRSETKDQRQARAL